MTESFDLADHPIFICGHPKSGTSLLRAALDGHPELVVYPEETMFFRRFLPAIQGKNLPQQMELADQLLIHIFTWNLASPPPSQTGFLDRDYSDVSFEAVSKALRNRIQTRYRRPGDLLSAAILAYGDVTGAINPQVKGWVEKTPYDEAYADQIFAWWPQARCIHVVRDPRDNYISYRKKHPDWSPRVFARSWEDSTRWGLQNQDKYGAERYWVVRYEDFVSQPEQGVANLCNFLGILESETLRVPTRNGRAWQGNSMFSNRFDAISAEAVGRWQDRLSPTEVAMIEVIDGALMKSLGYPISGTRLDALPFKDRLWLAWVKRNHPE